ncbi:MAG: family 43 glycosylhydrolase, partial [Clostridia bacterium]|nr:family 43 glycosylhydrolase [Clostridia bacterium]
DLHSWETAGAMMDGFSLAGYETDWEAWKYNGNCWAPEVIYDNGKYYMFYNMVAKETQSENVTEGGVYVGVAVSDTPVGPFKSIQATEGDINVPVVNFETNLDIGGHMPVIDISPFKDGDKRYIYFKTEPDSGSQENKLKNQCHFYCMEMEDWTTPKYETIKLVLAPNAVKVSTDEGALAALKLQGLKTEGYVDDVLDHYVMEGPQCIKRNGKYYLTYSVNGYTDPSYSVWQAVGTSPMGPFEKVAPEVGNPIISGRELNYAHGSGHHTFIDNGSEVFAVYHVHGNQTSMESSPGRFLFADLVHFTDTGIVVNGPTNYLQWLPESISGYKNLARTATVNASGKGKEFLTDEILPAYAYNASQVYGKDGDVEITFKFDKAVSVRAIMIYNSNKVETAFSKVDIIEFTLAEKADFMSKNYDKAVIYDLEYPKAYLSETDEYTYNPCAPAVADFNEIKVTSVTVKINGGSKLLTENRDGTKNKTINIAEIVILGV